MIGWLNPAALWALPLAALPVVIHLLRTHRARAGPVSEPAFRAAVARGRGAHAAPVGPPADVLRVAVVGARRVGARRTRSLLTTARLRRGTRGRRARSSSTPARACECPGMRGAEATWLRTRPMPELAERGIRPADRSRRILAKESRGRRRLARGGAAGAARDCGRFGLSAWSAREPRIAHA